jgi:hypothetical protein
MDWCRIARRMRIRAALFGTCKGVPHGRKRCAGVRRMQAIPYLSCLNGAQPSMITVMASVQFNPKGAVTFDVRQGSVTAQSDERLVLVSAAAIDAACKDLESTAIAALGHSIGRAAGERVAATHGGIEEAQKQGLGSILNHIAGELAVRGVGVLNVERWGRALLMVFDHASLSNRQLLAAIVEAAVTAASGKSVSTVSLSASPVRILVGNAATAERAYALTEEGFGYREVLVKLQEGV